MGDPTAGLCHLLTRAHFAGLPTTRSLWSHISYALDDAKDQLSPQDLLSRVLKACIQHPLSSVAPRDPKHYLSVLQWLGKAWQTQGWPIPEVLLTSEELKEPDECPELCYKTYVGWGGGSGSGMEEDSRGVTLLESSGGIIHHTTGLTTWSGAAILASWVTDNPEVVSGRKVLELGSGVGFTASVILTTSPDQEDHHPPPVSYTATDCHHHVLTLLHHNLELNLREEPMKREDLAAFQEATGRILVSEEVQAGQILPWKPESSQLRLSSKPDNITGDEGPLECLTQSGTKVEVLQVDWRQPPCPLPDVDVILAADVVYAHHLIPPLVALIKSLLNGTASSATTNKKTKVRKRSISKSEARKEDEETKLSKEEEYNETRKIEHSELRIETIKEESKGDGDAGEESDRDIERVAYIACTRRSQETIILFLEEIAKQGLVHSLVFQATLDTDTFLFVYNETHLPVKIFKVVLPQDNPVRES